jgi:hypothetical protein
MVGPLHAVQIRAHTQLVLCALCVAWMTLGCGKDTQTDQSRWRLDDVDMPFAQRDAGSIDEGIGPQQPAIQGEPCDVMGTQGRCARGRWLPKAQSEDLVCTPLYRPMPEVCDNEDNDCDGEVDYGPNPTTSEEFLARQAAFDRVANDLIAQGVNPERLQRLKESRTCPGFMSCTTFPSLPAPLADVPYTDVLIEFDAFMMVLGDNYPQCTAG